MVLMMWWRQCGGFLRLDEFDGNVVNVMMVEVEELRFMKQLVCFNNLVAVASLLWR